MEEKNLGLWPNFRLNDFVSLGECEALDFLSFAAPPFA